MSDLTFASTDSRYQGTYGEPVGIIRSIQRTLSLRWLTVATTAAALMAASACASEYPPQHDERLRKAAGVVTFQINCSKDLWERTRHAGYDGEVNAKSVKDAGNGTVVVSLSGPQLVDYLQVLGKDAFGWGMPDDPLAERMYNAIVPEVEKVRGPLKPGDPVPQVTVNDAAVPVSPSRSVSSTPSPSKPK